MQPIPLMCLLPLLCMLEGKAKSQSSNFKLFYGSEDSNLIEPTTGINFQPSFHKCSLDEKRNFVAKNKETKINACTSSPCKNGGTCSYEAGKFKCNCVFGYVGKTCDIPAYVGCYIDTGERALPYLQILPTEVPYISQCINKCAALNYPYAGLQLYDTCWSCNTYDVHGKAEEKPLMRWLLEKFSLQYWPFLN